PHTPGHDGVRLFLPAFGMLALLGSLGAVYLMAHIGRWARLVIAAALLEGAASIAVMMPVPLSYFSPIVGGLPGATALGMEPTYYWDAFSPEARRWLAANTPPGHIIVFAWFPHPCQYLPPPGEPGCGIAPLDPGEPLWYVLQNRPGAFTDTHRALVARSPAAYTVTKLGVSLLWIFPYREFRRWNSRQTPEPSPARSAAAQASREGSRKNVDI